MNKTILSVISIALFLVFPFEASAQTCNAFTGTRTGSAGLFVACTTSADCIDPLICVTSPSTGNSSCMTVQQCQQGANLGAQANYYNSQPSNAVGHYIRQPNGFHDNMLNAWSDKLGTQAGGTLGASAYIINYMASLYQYRPASTPEYLAHMSKNLFTPKEAYAQTGGFGFGSLSPILGLWALMRNIALLGYVMLFTVIGFMIMVRSKIDPRTVVTIQQAVPKIIVSLVLVIFSYGIVGFVIDSVTVATNLGATLLQSQGYIALAPGPASTAAKNPDLLRRLLSADLFTLWQQLYNVDSLIAGFANLDSGLNRVAAVLSIDAMGGGSLTRFVLWLAMFIALIRTFFMILTSYLQIVFIVIFSPLKFFMLALPGSSGFGEWLRSLLAHLLVFPVVFFMLAFAAIFYAQPNNVVSNNTVVPANVWRVGQTTFPIGQNFWVPPTIGPWGGLVGPLLTLGILLTIPRAGAIVKESILPKARPGASEGAVSEGIQKAAARIPFLGSFTRA